MILFSQACSEDVFNFFQKQTNDSYRFISELMDVFLKAGVHQQPDQSNYLAEDQTCKVVTKMAMLALMSIPRTPNLLDGAIQMS